VQKPEQNFPTINFGFPCCSRLVMGYWLNGSGVVLQKPVAPTITGCTVTPFDVVAKKRLNERLGHGRKATNVSIGGLHPWLS